MKIKQIRLQDVTDDSKVKYKFIAEIEEDGSGYYQLSERNKNNWIDENFHGILLKEHGTINDWIESAEETLKQQKLLLRFLKASKTFWKK